jgi:rhamnogalacturonan endolyase
MRIGWNRTFLVCFLAAVGALVLSAQTEKGSIPPNFGSYKLNPEYKGEPASYGWATERVKEKLGRGLVALRVSDSAFYLGWRLLESDPPTVAFNVYRSTGGGPPVRLNAKPIQRTTDYLDAQAPAGQEHSWWICPVVNGRELQASPRVTLAAGSPVRPYLAIRLRDDLPGSVDRIGIGDLDGDGEYDFIVKRPRGMVDPGPWRRSPDTFKIEAYRRDGAFLWRKDLGLGHRAGHLVFAHDRVGPGR